MSRTHDFTATVQWTGNRGSGTSGYRAYDRTWRIETPGKAPVECSNDPLTGGDPTLHNPEDLLISALSACHMLWFLHLASDAGIVVTGYRDNPVGIGESEPSGAGRFVRAILRPEITLADRRIRTAPTPFTAKSTASASSPDRSHFRSLSRQAMPDRSKRG